MEADNDVKVLTPNFDPRDLIFLMTFYKCLNNKCRVIFKDDSLESNSNSNKISELVTEASPSVQKLLKQVEGDAKPGTDRVNEQMADSIAETIDRKTTIFVKPKDTTYMVVVPQSKMSDFESWWRFKCQKRFRIHVLDQNDPNLTDEIEKEEFRRQLTGTK